MREFDPGESASIVSVTEKVRRLSVGMPVIAAHFLGEDAAFVGAEENVAVVNGQSQISQAAVHGGGILCVATDGQRIVMGGDDGKLIALDNLQINKRLPVERHVKSQDTRQYVLTFIAPLCR